MQALNLQLLETQNSKTQPKNFSSLKNETKSRVSFREMVSSVSKKDIKTEKRIQDKSESSTINNETMKSEKTSTEVDNTKNTIDNKDKKIISKETAENQKNMELENTEVLEESISLESIPLDFSIQHKNEIQSSTNNENVVLEEAIFVNENEYSYLKTKTTTNDDILGILENAIEYESEVDQLNNAQNLLIENPEKFLVDRQNLDENSKVVQLTVASFGNIEQQMNVSATKNNSKNENVFTLEVVDSKSEVKNDATNLFKDIFTVTDNRSVEEKIAQFKSLVNENVESSMDNDINLTLSMADNAAQNILSSNSQSAAAVGSTFQEMLTQQIQTNVPDFVKAGNIILRDNNKGTINMILKPESLGNVKINLQVTDNVITGQITVHSKEAFEAFKQNMDTLRQSFQESGFENANLNLSFADNSSSGAFAQNERQQGSEQFFGNKTYSKYATSVDADEYSVESVAYEVGSDKQVSIVA